MLPSTRSVRNAAISRCAFDRPGGQLANSTGVVTNVDDPSCSKRYRADHAHARHGAVDGAAEGGVGHERHSLCDERRRPVLVEAVDADHARPGGAAVDRLPREGRERRPDGQRYARRSTR